MGRVIHIQATTTATTHDARGDASPDEAPAPYAIHNPPRPARDTLIPHAGGGENPFQRQHQRQQSHSHSVDHNHKRSASTAVSTGDPDRESDSHSGEILLIKNADGRVAYQIVIDRVGHGMAPDQPQLAPEPVVTSKALAFAAVEPGVTDAEVQAAAQREWQWKHRDSIELALVGAAVLLVAAVVMVIARRQQRAYDRQQQQRTIEMSVATGVEATNDDASPDVERGELHVDASGLRVTQEDDEITTPASVVNDDDEGVV